MSPQESQAGSRPYRMRARAESAKATRNRILDAVEVCFDTMPYDEITLAVIAERSGVTVQTILRRFGSRQGLIVASLLHTGREMGRDRETSTDDPWQAIDNLVDHYDKYSGHILQLLAQEGRSKVLGAFTEVGRKYHARWCRRTFAAALGNLRGAERKRVVAQLVAITDIYTWKILRRDRGLSGPQTKQAMRELIEPLMERGS